MTLCELIRCAAMVSLAGILSANASGPYAFTQPHWAVTSTLNGMAGPNGLPSTAWFEWGATRAYGQTTAPVAVGESTGVVRVSAALSNLTQGNVYHARLVVRNAAGVAFGMDERLITPGTMKVALLGSGYCSSFPLPIPPDLCWPPMCFGDRPPSFVPSGISNIVEISPEGLVLRSDGVAFRWGTPVFSNVVAVAGGDTAYTVPPDLGLQADGTIVARGDPGGNVPPGLAGVIAISRGVGHGLALKSDGTVVAWESASGIHNDVPPGLSNVVAIAAGAWHSLALRVDGTVVAWGYNGHGQTNVPPGLTNVVAVYAGRFYSCAVRRDGTVVSWPDTQPNLVSDLTNVIAVAIVGGEFGRTSLALHPDGTITETGFHWGAYWRRSICDGIEAICAGLALGRNQSPLGYRYMTSVFQDRDSVVSLRGFDPNGDTLRFRIASLPSAGTLYQFQSGGRGSPILAAGTSVTDSEQRVVFAPEPATHDLDPSFTFIANDGELDSSPITFVISLTPDFPRIRMDSRGPCSASLRFFANTNQTYRVWASNNLLDWQALGNAWASDSTLFSFIDVQARPPARFYQVSTP